ncbi:MAG: hypothetical protein H6636_01185 [Anaerolineales bacterium]|nr:hypothetical protein [Anaerolineales bacterium]
MSPSERHSKPLHQHPRRTPRFRTPTGTTCYALAPNASETPRPPAASTFHLGPVSPHMGCSRADLRAARRGFHPL